MFYLLKKLIPKPLLSAYHYGLAFLGALWYGFPSRGLTVIGITGTNGKTTAVHILAHILEALGQNTASFSSIRFRFKDGGQTQEIKNELKMTMPGRFHLQKLLHQARKRNCQLVVMEVTSEGIKQFRHKFIKFRAAGFTNISPEHLESHGGLRQYVRAKSQLFKALASHVKTKAVLNLDDKKAKYFYRASGQAVKYGYTLGSAQDQPDLLVQDVLTVQSYGVQADGCFFRIKGVDLFCPLVGKFNLYNSLCAVTLAYALGFSLLDIKKALSSVKPVPGRLQIVIKEPFKVIVDYAHTPDGLQRVYQTIRQIMLAKHSRLIAVLGSAGGGRDKWKRKQMGALAGKYADKIIITNEDPYDEDPQAIIDQAASGVARSLPLDSRLYEILDRRQAIAKAISLAQPKDVIIITGKGCEPWLCVAGGQKIPWDDRQVVREEMAKLK